MGTSNAFYMKKILLLCDGDNFPSGATRFIRQMRDNEPIYVKGLFMNPVDVLEMMPVGFIPVSGPYERLNTGRKTTGREKPGSVY